jgi:hypothetical protein
MIINFEFETQYGKFADALVFPDEQELPSNEEIENMKQQRLDNWLLILDTSAQVIQEPIQESIQEPIQEPEQV